MRCPYCRDPAVGWLQGTAFAVAAATVLFFLIQTF
jgi:hypothetical protein